MIEKDLEKLIARDCHMDLAGLEQDIWRQLALRRTSYTLASWQGVVLALGIFGSAAIGAALAARLPPGETRLFASGQEMAPSALLFGKNQ